MFEILSKEIRKCRRHAEECKRKSKIAQCPSAIQEYLEMEQRWLDLARSYELEMLCTKEGKTVTVEADKANDLVEKPRLAFQFEPVELARDGLTVATAPVLVPCDTRLTAGAAKRKAMPKGARIALRALVEAVAEAGTAPPASNHIPAGTKTVTVERWRTYTYRRGISTSEEPRARQQAFKRATEHLISERHVGIWDDQAWPVSEIDFDLNKAPRQANV